jgi:hypothetical protein
MHTRIRNILTALAVLLGLGEFASAVIIKVEAYPDSFPAAAVAFGCLFLVGAWLLRGSRVTAGTVMVGILCLFEVVSFPGWTRHNALDWSTQIGFVVVSLAGLVTAIAVLVSSRRSLHVTA